MTQDAPRAALEALRAEAEVPDLAARRAHLDALAQVLRREAEALVRAVDADFGGRHRAETMLAEITMALRNIRWTRRRLRRWCRARRIALPYELWPSRGRVSRVPLGVVGILAPWNYPLQLALVPLIAALAGGNRVILKPSEHAPRTAQALAGLLEEALPDRVRVVQGDARTAEALCRLPLDGLFFTGGTETGRRIMAAAADNLTPLVLELGGKSPALLLEDTDLEAAARSIIAGKLLNAGQTCVAPDYLLVPRAQMEPLLQALKAATTALYPDPESGDYTAIPRESDRARLAVLLEGQRAEPLMARMPAPPRMGAWAVIDPPADAPVMRQEVFGPVLPLVPYDSLTEAQDRVNADPCPLALYVYGRDGRACDAAVAAIRSGGAMINDAVVHVTVHGLPFGGAGASGFGSYHGEEGFRSFTRPRSVLTRRRPSLIDMAKPPYGKRTEDIIRRLLR
ncbi:aldehyde dehydrogenase family protein [Pseudoroseicyclus aestuarii]|uniref:Aldehyde dehydrogenase n=1 Tax=Pseudoroseicyclus aestuarii TaxID=1795041 RepID=A0A318SVM5_9RHOB|nr:aldehyde dehydrogenase family protein [Pseudoroseicyclus aestuarii]PYE85961.1 coniferyl-aldehyde dehydrogenase [Pseudoroseicyclus aestuarii]